MCYRHLKACKLCFGNSMRALPLNLAIWAYALPSGTLALGFPAVLLNAVIRNQGAWVINLKWAKPAVLTIQYLSAVSVRVDAKTQAVGNQINHIVLKKGITDDTAALGGMYFNLHCRQ